MRERRTRRRLRRNVLFNDLHLISKILFVLILMLLIIFIYSAIRVKNTQINNKLNLSSENISSEDSLQTNTDQNSTTSQETLKDTTINVAITGDIMCHNTIFNDAFNSSTGSYDFSYIFEDIKYYIQTADIAVGNLETTFAGSQKKYSGYPTFNTPEQLAYNLKKVGFDVVSTANNHCYDSGYKGLESTIDYLDDADISHTGTFKSEESQNTVLIKSVKGIKIAFLSFTYGTNGIPVPSDKTYSVNLIDTKLISNQLTLAKEQNPDLICVCMHWGEEYQTTPNLEQKNLAKFLFENGADIIIGNHPHVIQPMEKREITLTDGTTKEGFIVYSLGNFLADQNKTYTRDSAILNLNITRKSNGKISINSATYTPIYTYKNSSVASQKIKLIDLKDITSAYEAGYTSGISESLYKTFSSELANVKKLLGEEIK